MIYELLLKYILVLLIICTLLIYNRNTYKSDCKNNIKELFDDSKINCNKKCKKKHNRGSDKYRKCKKKCKKKNKRKEEILVDKESIPRVNTDDMSYKTDYMNSIDISSSISDIVDDEINQFRKDVTDYPIDEIERLKKKLLLKNLERAIQL